MEWDGKKLGLVDITVMVVSLIWLVSAGIGKNEGLVPLIVFAVSLAIGLLFFEDWFGEE